MGKLMFEDFFAGQQFVSGPRLVNAEEIKDFARKFDPQPFHLDEEAAKQSMFRGLAASGWHTAAIAMRLLVDGFIGNAASMGSPGMDELRWLKPVRPGDSLTLTTTVTETVPSRSKPDRGIVKFVYELRNQQDELVMSMKGMGLYGRRGAQA